MKRKILTGILALAAGVSTLAAQQGQSQQGKTGQQAQPAQPAPPAPKGPTVKSQAEGQAVMALQNAQADPDATIKAAEDLITKFADTDFKEIALFMEANAYRAKRDNDKAQIYAQRVLEINPKNFSATLMLGEILSSTTRENDLDREDKLTRAENLLNQTIENVKAAAKPNPQLSDADWEEARKDIIAEAHNGIGLSALTRKKYDVAIAEFKTAYDDDAQPAYAVRLASSYQWAGRNDEAIALCDKVLADPQMHPQIRQVAQAVKNAALQAKGAGAPPEVKKP